MSTSMLPCICREDKTPEAAPAEGDDGMEPAANGEGDGAELEEGAGEHAELAGCL